MKSLRTYEWAVSYIDYCQMNFDEMYKEMKAEKMEIDEVVKDAISGLDDGPYYSMPDKVKNEILEDFTRYVERRSRRKNSKKIS